MRIEYQLTAEEFVNAQIAHAANSPPMRVQPTVVGTLVFAAAWVGYGAFAWRSFPWLHPDRPIDTLMACVVAPVIPWTLVLARSAFVLGSQQPLHTAWKPGNRIATAGGSSWRSWRRILFSAAMLIVPIVVIAVNAPLIRGVERGRDWGQIFFPTLFVIMLPIYLYGFWGTLTTKIMLRPQAWRAWNQQTHLHLPTTVEIDVERVVLATDRHRLEYQWTAFVGSLETPSQFLLYLSPAAFDILPKRAFAGGENLDAMHHLLAAKLAEPISAFPVQGVISKPLGLVER